MKKKDIYKLKRCLRDFKTKDHLCLFVDLLSFYCLSKIVYHAPSVGLRLFLFVFVFFVWFWASLHWFFFFFAQNFWIIWIFLHAPKLCLGTFDDWEFSFMPPSVAWAVSIIEVFSMSLALAPNLGCDPNPSYFQKILLGSKGDCKGYILALWKDYQRWPFFIPNLCI